MSDMMIAMQNVSKVYNPESPVFALRNVDLRVESGEFTAIIGPSGSGKSTLMNIMGCLDIATTGKYFLCGQDVSCMGRDMLAYTRGRRIGFVFQGFNLVHNYTALENVELPMVYTGVDPRRRRRRAAEALEEVGLGHRLHHTPGQLSGGQQQRVAIARAVVGKPPLLLADEPTGNLDSASGEEIMALLQALNAAGSTIILITHDSRVAGLAGRVLRIADGMLTDWKVAAAT